MTVESETRIRARRALPAAPWAAATAFVLLVAVASACIGAYPVPPADVAAVVAHHLLGMPLATEPIVDTVVWQVRLPRVLAGFLVGAALAAAGAAYQGLFRNPLVSPDVLGVSAGASLGAVLGIFLSLPLLAIQGLSFVGGLVAVGLVYAIGAAVRRRDPVLVLVLAGVAVGSMLGAAISLVKILADPYNQLPAITYWLLGSLASVTRADTLSVVPAVALGLLPLALFRWRMNLLSLGDEEARALGVETKLVRPIVIAGATLATAAVVSISGVIGWIGLVVPHVARMLVGPDFARLLPASMLIGGGYLVLVDLLARTIARSEVPLGILTAVVGAPFLIWLLASERRGWS